MISGENVKPSKKTISSWIILVGSLLFSSTTVSVTRTFAEEYEKLIKSADIIKSEGPDMFGDKTNLYTGGTEFSVTDINIPGNNSLLVSFGRKLSVGLSSGDRNRYMMGGWEPNIPYIGGVFSKEYGWQLEHLSGGLKRCSGARQANEASPIDRPIDAARYWHGYQLVTPESGTQEVLFATEQKTKKPANGQNYPWVTKGFWQLSCLDSLQNAEPGEGFLAVSPQGTKYYLDWMTKQEYTDILQPTAEYVSGQNITMSIARQDIRLYATKIEDIHGNWVKYNWSGDKLNSITSSDNRTITFTYKNLGRGINPEKLESATANGKTWRYGYDANLNLTEVVLPNNTSWRYDTSWFVWLSYNYEEKKVAQKYQYEKDVKCNWMRILKNNESKGYVIHPSGARADYTFDVVRHGRTFVDEHCIAPESYDLFISDKPAEPEDLTSAFPARFDVLSLKSKKISGPGLKDATWTYDYEKVIGGFKTKNGMPSCGNCPVIKKNTVFGPGGEKNIYTFGVKFEENEGQLLKTETYSNGVLYKTISNTYVSNAQAAASPFPDKVGTAPHGEYRRQDSFSSERIRPVNRTVIDEQRTDATDSFTMEYTGFNEFGLPVTTTERNSLGYVKYEKLGYFHDLKRWLINLPTTVELSSNGSSWSTISETRYYQDNEPYASLPKDERRFSALVKVYESYHGNGNLKRQNLGDPKRWQEFADYYRGVPRTFTLPERYDGNKTISAKISMNDDGTIAKTTDFNGQVTDYAYDLLGRISKIKPQDSAWSETTISYADTDSNDISVAAGAGLQFGQPRQRTTRGAYEKTIWYDAFYRPVLTREQDINKPGSARYLRQEFNTNNNPTFNSFPSTSASSFTGRVSQYDVLQRLTQQSDTDNTRTTKFEYLSGNRVRTTNGRNSVTTTSYLAYGRPDTSLPTQIEAPEAQTTTISYDLFNNIERISQGGFTETRLYDAYKNLCKIIRPEFGQRLLKNSPQGWVEWQAEGLVGSTTSCESAYTGDKVSLTYDNHGALWKEDYSDATPDRLYSRDNQGALLKLETLPAIWNYRYNSAGLLESETLSIDNKSFAFTHAYNGLGYRTATTYPNNNKIEYAPNALGQPTKAGNYARDAIYFPNGMLASFTYGNDYRFSQSLDTKLRPETLTILDKNYTSKAALFHQYDENNNLKNLTDLLDGSYSQSHSFDGLDRLKTASGKWGAGSFNYDNRNNLLSQSLGTQAFTYSIDPTTNRLASVSGAKAATLGYDARGNVSHNGRHSLTYGLDNRLKSAGDTMSFIYDGHGRMVKKTVDGKISYSVYGLDGTLYQQVDPDGSATRFIRLGKQPVAQFKQAQ